MSSKGGKKFPDQRALINAGLLASGEKAKVFAARHGIGESDFSKMRNGTRQLPPAVRKELADLAGGDLGDDDVGRLADMPIYVREMVNLSPRFITSLSDHRLELVAQIIANTTGRTMRQLKAALPPDEPPTEVPVEAASEAKARDHPVTSDVTGSANLKGGR